MNDERRERTQDALNRAAEQLVDVTAENTRLRATIERVRAALDFCDRGSAIAIRAALNEERE